jgi:hypothetical protein
MAFTPVTVTKDGRDDRVASSAVELVQFEHDGWSAVAAEAPAPDADEKPALPSGITVAENATGNPEKVGDKTSPPLPSGLRTTVSNPSPPK